MARTKPGPGSGRFAFSGPFQLLSEEGLRVVRSIVAREEHRSTTKTLFLYSRTSLLLILYCGTYTTSSSRSVASARGSKRALRGLYYSSPFIRALQTSPQVRTCAGVCRSVRECVEVCRNVGECEGLCRNVSEWKYIDCSFHYILISKTLISLTTDFCSLLTGRNYPKSFLACFNLIEYMCLTYETACNSL